MGLGVNEMSKLTVDAQIHDLEYQAQNINQQKLAISQQLEENAKEYEAKTSNRQMKIGLFLSATGSSAGFTDTSKTMNLTYAALVSATVGLETGKAGIQACDTTKNQPYTSNSYFRLVDPDGAIVVSNINEIPGVISTTKETEVSSSQVYKSENNTTALTSFLEQDDVKDTTVAYDETGIIRVTAKENDQTVVKYFDAKTGEDVTDKYSDKDEQGKTKFNKADTNKFSVSIEKDTTTGKQCCKVKRTETEKVEVHLQGANGIMQGEDGVYELVDENGTPLTDFPKYRVDSMLTAGYSENGSSTNGPNYLQDCIRNGKYMLQQGNNDNDEKEFKWKNLSWDSITSISDNYYTEDDDAAKAKYDRIQSQLNAQEKKLDLQLDTIETQRSALTQQKESIDKCLEDNMESFKTFA